MTIPDETVYRAIMAWHEADHLKMRAALEAIASEITEHAIVGALMRPITGVLCDPPEELQTYIECDMERMEWKKRAEELEQQKDEWANLFTDANHRLKEAEAALSRLLAPHFDEDGIIEIFSASTIVGTDGNGRLQLKGSFIAALEAARAALKVRPREDDIDVVLDMAKHGEPI